VVAAIQAKSCSLLVLLDLLSKQAHFVKLLTYFELLFEQLLALEAHLLELKHALRQKNVVLLITIGSSSVLLYGPLLCVRRVIQIVKDLYIISFKHL